MLGPTHRVTGGLFGVVAAAYAGQPPSMVVMSGIVATAASHGWLSPDVDQTKPWVAVRKALPRFCGPLLNHRTGLSHWWGLAALAGWGIGFLTPEAQWPAAMLLVGWTSHLVGDFLFGSLAIFPWGGPTFGLGLATGGLLEVKLVRPLTGLATAALLIHSYNPNFFTNIQGAIV